MVDEERFLYRMARLEADLAALARFQNVSLERLTEEIEVRWAAERGLHVVIDGLLELGAHVLASDFGVQALAYRETAVQMVAHGIVTVTEFPRIASFRNVLVHEYVKLDLALLAVFLATGLADLAACARDLRLRVWER